MKLTTCARCLGLDTSVYVHPKYHKLLWQAGYRLIIRYIWKHKYINKTPNSGWPVALSVQELIELTDAGFGVGIVQIANSQSLIPSDVAGEEAGDAAAFNAYGLGVPKGATIWCDAEWPVVPSNAPVGVLDYLNGWSYKETAGAYEAGLYVGGNMGLSSKELYGLPRFRHYWKSASAVPWVYERGFQMIQGTQTTLFKTDNDNGLLVDQDIVCLDNKYERFMVVVK